MKNRLGPFLREEWFLGLSTISCIAFHFFGNALWNGSVVLLWLGFPALFLVAAGAAISVVRHADHLAEILGEPYGTLILTLSVTSIEVISISAVMLHGGNNPTLARDTLFAVLMIILNGMVGVSLLIGAWRHQEQQYNLQGANAYLGVIIPLAVLSLVMPNFTRTTPGPTLSTLQEGFLLLTSLGLYAIFLAIQTGRHRGFFALTEDGDGHATAAILRRSRARHGILLVAYMVPVVILAEELATPLDYLIETLHAPVAFGGVVIAVLVATPEALGAVRAAMSNNLQRSVNIFLGSVLSTIGLTVPAMIAISNLTGRKIELGLQNGNLVMLMLTLAVSVVTFASGRTNVMQGAVHLILFFTFLLLLFQG